MHKNVNVVTGQILSVHVILQAWNGMKLWVKGIVSGVKWQVN